MRRNNLLVAAALILSAACRRPAAKPVEAAPGVTLDAPAPSSNTVTSPLTAAPTGFTNDMQAQSLREQSAQLGIIGLGKPSTRSIDSDEPQRTITYQEGIERTREMSREIESERHAIDADKIKSVALPGQTAGVLPANKEGAPIESAPEDPGSKDPK